MVGDPGSAPFDRQRSRDVLADLVGAETVGEHTPRLPEGRRGARAAAVQALYESDMTGHPAGSTAQRLADEAGLGSGHRTLAADIVEHVERQRGALDHRIERLATRYPAEQIAAVDRIVLRVALAEMAVRPDRPKGVIINEAVEIAKLFGSEASGRFVNGVLGALLR